MRIEQVLNRNFHLATGIIFVKSDLREFFKSEFTKFPSKLEIVAAISDLLLLDIRLFSSLYFVVTYTGSSTFKPRITLSKNRFFEFSARFVMSHKELPNSSDVNDTWFMHPFSG